MINHKKLINTIYLNKYKIIKLLDDGGMNSAVFLAENIYYSKEDSYLLKKFKYVALKFVRKTQNITKDNWIKNLDEQITIARLKNNPYVVELELCFPADVNSEWIVFSMEYMDGPNLRKLIKDRGCLALAEALSILKKIVLGLKHMQTQARIIIHRDLKPENILFSKNLLEVKISDFGIASVLYEVQNEQYKLITNENEVFGTIPYICPDIIDVAKTKVLNITKQYDFHALGIIFYEMLVGEKPFYIAQENDPSVISYFRDYDITPLQKVATNLNGAVENLFLKLTASKPNDKKYRYQDCDAILADIQTIEQMMQMAQQTAVPLLIAPEKRTYQIKNLLPTFLSTNIWKASKKMPYLYALVFSITVFVILFFVLVFLK